MKLADLVRELELEVLAGPDLEREVTGGYASDLLSLVMARAKAGQLWITLQGHQNIVAVAVLLELAGVIVAGGIEPDQEPRKTAEEDGTNLLASSPPASEPAGRLYQLGARETDQA